MKFITISLISTLLVFSCKPEPEENLARIESEVNEMLNDYFDATRDHGLLAGIPFLDKSDQFFWVPPGYQSWISYDSVVNYIETNAPHVAEVDNQWIALRVEPLTHWLATYTGEIKSVSVSTSGQRNEAMLLETGIAIRRASTWKMLNGQTRIKD